MSDLFPQASYFKAARQPLEGGPWELRVKWYGRPQTQNSWKLESDLRYCQELVDAFWANASDVVILRVDLSGEWRMRLANPEWIRAQKLAERAQEAEDEQRKRQLEATPSPQEPDEVHNVEANNPHPKAEDLWKPPVAFGLDADDRATCYQVVCASLEEELDDGEAFFQRVKAELRDKDDKNWLAKDRCPICLEDIVVDRACLLTCTDKKHLYCNECVLRLRAMSREGLARCPFCSRLAYFVSTKWVYVNDPEARQEIMEEKARKFRREKKKAAKERRRLESVNLVTEVDEIYVY